MISVTIYREDDVCKGFEVRGHAGAAEYGKDIVCASISVLAISCANGLSEILGAELDTLEYSSGNMKIMLKDEDFKIKDKAALLIATFEHGARGVAELHPKYVKVTSKEVKS